MTVIVQQYSPYMYHWLIRPSRITKKYIHQRLQQNFQFDDKRVLDFGSGTGANSILFSPENYIGIDPDVHRVTFAKKQYPDYTFSSFEGNQLPIPSNELHYILIIAVLHHISTEDIVAYLPEFKRVLKPSGRMIILEPYLDQQDTYCNWFMKWFDKGRYIRREDDYYQLFTNHGYQCSMMEKFKKCYLYNELLFTVQSASQETTGSH